MTACRTSISPVRRASEALRSVGRRAALALLMTAATAASGQVGLARLDLGGVPVTLVYPTATAAARQAYGPFELDVAADAEPLPGARRLVVMSHGTGGSPLPDHALAATLARAGFVVAQPLHAGDNHQDASRAGPESWLTRPQEVSRVIDALAAHPQWRERLKLDRVGVHGSSAGGLTALTLAGARWRTLNLVRHCQEHLEDDLGFCFNGAADPAVQARRRESYERARGVPEGFLPESLTAWRGGRESGDARPDTRIAVVTVSVPVVAPVDAASLARLAVPVGVVSAGRDTMLLPRFHSGRLLHQCTRCTRLADLPDATHFDLLWPWPDAIARPVAALHPRGGEATPGFPAATRSTAYERIAAFLRDALGD